MSLTAEAIYRIGSLSRNQIITHLCATFHVDLRDSEALQISCDSCSGIDTAPAREIFFFAAAILKRHHENRTAYSVAIRRSA